MAETKKIDNKKETTKNLVGTRGRIFKGKVIKKFPHRLTIEFDRPVYIKKYERFYKKKTRIHARIPESLRDKIELGDIIKVQESRPLSKIIHAVVIEIVSEKKKEKIKSGEKAK
jgi:small subunit ribosomal protein S17